MKKLESLNKFNDYFFDDAFNSNRQSFFQFLSLSGGISDRQYTANCYVFYDTTLNNHCSCVYHVSFMTCIGVL
jgi:hypothetical protein